jgi:murein DD-endopeptidase MepM/ murein hydrolase activator NlpD
MRASLLSWRFHFGSVVAVFVAVGGLVPPSAVAGQAPGTGTGSATSPTPISYRPPLLGRVVVVRPFSGDVGTYSAGHRGVDLAGVVGQNVVSASDGIVTFAGVVAGRGVVTVRHADLIVTEYEPVQASVGRGMTVTAGTVLGTITGVHKGCETPCLHWGAKRGDRYLDPLSLLRPLGVVHLIPVT